MLKYITKEVFNMKIITDKAVYVEKNDIAYLSQTDFPIPALVLEKVMGIIGDRNRYEFVKIVKDLTNDEIIELGQSIAQARNKIAQQFNSMSKAEQQENFDMLTKCELLDYKMSSLRDILWFKQGHLPITLPEEIDHSKKDENKVQKPIRRIFPKRKK